MRDSVSGVFALNSKCTNQEELCSVGIVIRSLEGVRDTRREVPEISGVLRQAGSSAHDTASQATPADTYRGSEEVSTFAVNSSHLDASLRTLLMTIPQ